MRVQSLSAEAVAAMRIVDLSTVTEEPDGPVESFAFHDCTTGVASFVGRPPWELHTAGDELPYILSGECELTVLEPSGRVTRTLRGGDLVVVPQGCWHNNDAAKAVRMLYITPTDGNDHSWDEPDT